MIDDDLPAGPEGRRVDVCFSARLARAICARVAAGESQVSICAEPGMPSRGTLFRWARDRPTFAAALARARAAGGRVARGGYPSSYCPVTANEIFDRLCEGESITAICRDPAMPAFSTVYYWRKRFPEFAEAIRVAREVQAERFCDLGWEIAGGVTPETAYATHVKLAQLRWTAAVMAPTRYGRLKALEPTEVEIRPPEVQRVSIRAFEVEEGPDGVKRVVSYTPDPDTGRVVRRVRGED